MAEYDRIPNTPNPAYAVNRAADLHVLGQESMKQIVTFICLALFVGCAPSQPRQTARAPEIKTISSDEARQIASAHWKEFIVGKTFTDFGGTVHPYYEFPTNAWHQVEKTTNGWSLACDPPAGCHAYIEMDAYGKNVKVVRYGYAPQ